MKNRLLAKFINITLQSFNVVQCPNGKKASFVAALTLFILLFLNNDNDLDCYFMVAHLYTCIITGITYQVMLLTSYLLPPVNHILLKRRKNGIQLCSLLLDITNVKSKNQV